VRLSEANNFGIYDENPSSGPVVDCYDLAPIVNYGSLASMQSYAGPLLRGDRVYTEDLMAAIANGRVEGFQMPAGARFFEQDQQLRARHRAIDYQRMLCDPSYRLSIQDVVGNARAQSEPLFDSEGKEAWQLKVLFVPAVNRGDSLFDSKFLERALIKQVYITSSHVASVPPGLYRLIDLPIFAELSCSAMPMQQCAPRGFRPQYLNLWAGHAALWERSPKKPGRFAVLKHRCQDDLRDFLRIQNCPVEPSPSSDPTGRLDGCCDRAPYRGQRGCFGEDLGLVDQPLKYPSKYFWNRLQNPPPAPPPTPAAPPPLPPGPPPPKPPPPNPMDSSIDRMKQIMRVYEDAFCSSVYFLSAQTRCAQLAADLQQPFYSSLFIRTRNDSNHM
jgi:hypothetical protein